MHRLPTVASAQSGRIELITMELFKASNQWSTRPDDERFWTVAEALDQTKSYAESAVEKVGYHQDLRVEAVGTEIHMLGKSGIPARLSHHAFGQIAGMAGAPAGYLRDLPATLAAQNVNHGLKARGDNSKAQMLFHRNGEILLRAITSDNYSRIWNFEVFERLQEMTAQGWKVPPARPSPMGSSRSRPATEADILRKSNSVGGLKVKVGDMIAPAGVYASDHDMFCFLINEDRRIDDGSADGLSRGLFLWNSEVGAKSLGIQEFRFKSVCGNHIVWGASGVKEVRIRHVGKGAREAFRTVHQAVRAYNGASASGEEDAIRRAQRMVLGTNRAETLDAVYKLVSSKRIPLGQKLLGEALDLAEKRVDDYGSPRTVWAVGNALTELSQKSAYAEDRVAIDTAAGKLMQAAVF